MVYQSILISTHVEIQHTSASSGSVYPGVFISSSADILRTLSLGNVHKGKEGVRDGLRSHY